MKMDLSTKNVVQPVIIAAGMKKLMKAVLRLV